MSDSFEVHVSGTRGDVHTGTGDINSTHYLLQLDSPGRAPRKQPADELRWLSQRFVPPAGLGEARDVLEASRTVFLDGPPGSGRVAAAKMLLWELRNDAEQLHEVVLQGKEDASRINPDHVGDGDRVWLDLSQVDGQLWGEVHAELSSLRATVRQRDAYLVVVLPDTVDDLGSTLAQYRVEIQRPAVGDVLSRYLMAEDIPQPTRLPPLRFLDTARRMDQIRKYVALIVRAREKDRESGFIAWCETADQALSGQEQDVATLVAGLTEGPPRALLLATAILHEAHADIVHRASASLLKTVEHPRDESPILVRDPLDHRLEEIGAELDSTGNVRFRKLDYDAAVRSYFWTHMPELHGHIQEWVRETVDMTDLTSRERENLVTWFTDQCLNERYRPALVSLVNQWTANPTTPRKMEAAAVVLQRGLQHEKQGRFFRRQIYEWSRITNLSDRLAEVIIVACRDEMMTKHPDEALVRLHHVARREHGTRARETLIQLVSGAPRLRRQMLNRLTDPSEPGKWPADVDLFLELADPESLTDPGKRGHPLIAENSVRRQLTIGWALAFAQRPHEEWAPQVRRWLHVAAGNERYRHALLDVLIGGGAQRTSVLAHFYTMTREQCASLSGSVMQKINIAQGVQPA
ncbi:hypothetical protein AB0L00_43290 [Actinoallomurus sp. NPDC052308]|uniref:hypothetical protein n=1 Tax=Actinoallomurus sp. NPDC052308 TaxID=3155530 RepID=UPI0034246FAE